MNTPGKPAPALADLLLALRPSQWTKNCVVLAAFAFALGDRMQTVSFSAFFRVAAATVLFCLVSSGVYILNDLKDAALDRLHPVKKHRPIAAGRVPVRLALCMAGALLVAGLAGAVALSRPLALILTGYVALQLGYTLWLKQVALVDILLIAFGFVLRAIAGAVVVNVAISPWLLVCAFMLALFLALCKRRHEKVTLEDAAAQHRAALEHYDQRLLDQLIGIISGATIVCYAIYTLWPDTVHKFGTTNLAFTIPLVIFGIFRYLDLVYRHDGGGRPEKILLTDGPLLIDLGLYGLAVLAIFAAGR
jgi:4-hydroxybenzoate polyprenyltransferase